MTLSRHATIEERVVYALAGLRLPRLAAPRAPHLFSARKVGGLTFLRLGRLSVSYCLTTKPV